jgi:hypothetical protein
MRTLLHSSTLLAMLPLLACGTKSIGLGRGEAVDARLYADLYTWGCAQEDTGGGVADEWEGVYAYNITLEYAPDGLVDRSVPESGCSDSLDIFPEDAGSAGHDLPDTPSWANGSTYSGTFLHENTGFYAGSAFASSHSCAYPEDVIGDGTTISNADVFSGARSPAPGTVSSVIDGTDGSNNGLQFGEDVNVSWEASGWDESWVQIRRETNGELVQGLTCKTTGDSAFTIDQSIWDQLSNAIEVDVTNIYVGFGKHDSIIASDGEEIQTWTREMHTAVVQD